MPQIEENLAVSGVVDTYGGVVRVVWDHEAEVTPYGQLIFFGNYSPRLMS